MSWSVTVRRERAERQPLSLAATNLAHFRSVVVHPQGDGVYRRRPVAPAAVYCRARMEGNQ